MNGVNGRRTLYALGGVAVFALSLVSPWFQFPISGETRGVDVLSWNDPWLVSGIGLLWGAVGLLLVGLVLNRRRLIAASLAVFPVITITPLFLFAFSGGEQVSLFVEEALQQNHIAKFYQLVATPVDLARFSLDDSVDTATVAGRIRVTASAISYGWFLALGATAALLQLGRGSLTRGWVLVTVLGTSMVVAAVAGPFASATLERNRAKQALAANHLKEAQDRLLSALQEDPSLLRSRLFLHEVSGLSYRVDGVDHPRAQLHRAAIDARARRVVAALERLDGHVDSDGTPPELARALGLAETDLYRNLAIESFLAGLKSKREVHWAQFSARMRASQFNAIDARWLLAQVHHKEHKISDCLSIVDELTRRVVTAGLAAELYNLKGDCLTRAGRLGEARHAYRQSFDLDSSLNYRAVRGLTGS